MAQTKTKNIVFLLLVILLCGGGYFYAKYYGYIDKWQKMAGGEPKISDQSSVMTPLEPPAKSKTAPVGQHSEAAAVVAAANSKSKTVSNGEPLVINVGVITWGGYAGAEWFNNGFSANTKSRFLKDYNLKVNFVIIDNTAASRDAFKSGDIDVLWTTVDSYNADTLGIPGIKLFFQADYSRGGDLVLGRDYIKTINDLKGKKVAYAPLTSGHAVLIKSLRSAGLTMKDIVPVPVESPVESANTFKTLEVDAAAMWSPDDADCIDAVPGSKVLMGTTEHKNLVADAFFAKKEYIATHREELKNLIRGWMIGNAEVNMSEDKKMEAAEILAKGFNMKPDFCLSAINNARLSTFGDNINFFGLNPKFKGVTAEMIYNDMTAEYRKTGDFKPSDRIPMWREVVDTSLLQEIDDLTGPEHAAEKEKEFTAMTVEEVKTSQVLATKTLTISFLSGQSTLDDSAKTILQIEIIPQLKQIADLRMKIDGHTDNVGNPNTNLLLSQKRADAVRDYLVSNFGFSPNRFICTGYGSTKPIADNATAEGKSKNRRTEFTLIK